MHLYGTKSGMTELKSPGHRYIVDTVINGVAISLMCARVNGIYTMNLPDCEK